jgi:hypothetical protein
MSVKTLEPAPQNSLPDWSECQLRCHNSDLAASRKAEGGYGEESDGLYAKQLHRFIYEYDDADSYKSEWFMHRLELLINEIRADAIRDYNLQRHMAMKHADYVSDK